MATRPVFTDISPGTETWLTTLNDALNAIFNAPFPIASYAIVGSLPDAALYLDCLAHVQSNDTIYKSNGASWIGQPKVGAVVSDAIGWSDSTAQTDFNSLLQDLRDANVIQ